MCYFSLGLSLLLAAFVGGGVTLCFKVSLLDPLRDKSLGI